MSGNGRVARRVVLDCDTANEIDDQFAIAYALGSDALDVLAVISVQNTLVHGSDSVEIYQREAQRLVDLAGRPEVPCPQGAARPMEHPSAGEHSEGIALLAELAEEAPLTLLATGPATDAASFVLHYPQLADRVEIIWAGAFPDEPTWQRYKFGELNARADIQAWRALFDYAPALRVLPGWPGVEQVAVSAGPTIERLRALGQPLTDYLGALLEGYVAARDGALDMDDPTRAADRKVLWDIVNVAAVHQPESVTWTEQALPQVDPAGAPDWKRTGRTVPFGLQVDAELVLDDLWNALSSIHG